MINQNKNIILLTIRVANGLINAMAGIRSRKSSTE